MQKSIKLKYYNILTLLIFALNSNNTGSERSKGLEESAVGSLSLVVLALDLGSLGGGVLVDVLESVLVLTSLELVFLPCNSGIVGSEVSIGGGLGSGSGIKISLLSGLNEVLGNFVIESLEVGIEGSLLSMNGGTVGGLSSTESRSVSVWGGSELGSGLRLGSTSGGISTSSSGLMGISSSLSSGSLVVGLGGTVESVVLGNLIGVSGISGWLIEVISETLVAPFTLAVTIEGDGRGGGDEKSSDGE
jgi:hypothetical protein